MVLNVHSGGLGVSAGAVYHLCTGGHVGFFAGIPLVVT